MLLERLREFKNYQPTDTRTVIIGEKQYPVTVQGNGKLAALSVGGATLMQRTLSPRFKGMLTFYACDLYWPKNYRIDNLKALTIDKIVDDIFSVIDQLGLEELILFGHTAYWITALEAAKRCDSRIKAIIMVGTPTESNTNIAQVNNDFFEQHASPMRKENDRMRKEHYSQIKKPTDSEISLNSYESCSARYWGDYNVSREFLEELWQGVEIDDEICNHFFGTLLPNHITAKDIKKIEVPVVLLASRKDYDCLPLELWQSYPKPGNLTIVDCGEVGHWSNIENPRIFDEEIEKWLIAERFINE